MTFTTGGTITLNEKTYNISMISAVYIEKKDYENEGGGLISLGLISVLSSYILYTHSNSTGNFILVLGFGGFGALILFGGISTLFAVDYRLIFEMGGGTKVVAYQDKERHIVEQLEEDIIVGIQRGYFPNYLQGRNQ